jgi:hypothetical protein
MSVVFSATRKVTDTVTLCKDNPAYDMALHLDRFQLEGVEYIRRAVIARKGKRNKDPESGSGVWRFGESLVRQTDSKDVYYCWICERNKRSQSLPVLNGTKGAIDHLRDIHKIDKDGHPLVNKAGDGQQSLNFSSLVTTYEWSKFKALLVRWIVYCQLAITMLENTYFREVIGFLNEGVLTLLPVAQATLRLWIIEAWQGQKEVIKKELKDAVSSIHLSFDLWTSPNHFAIISVYAHFISDKGHRKQRLLAFQRVRGVHTGENQAGTVLAVIKDYEIDQKIGYFMTDNAQSNDVCIDIVLQELYPHMPSKQRAARRLRCLGHIVNLCARALLLGKGATKAIDDAEVQLRRGALESLDEFWRQRGAIGRLHNIVRYIRATPQRMEEFAEINIGGNMAEFDDLEVRPVAIWSESSSFSNTANCSLLQLIADNTTRWNSFYQCLQRALNVKERIIEFCRTHKPSGTHKRGLRDDRLIASDWYQLERLHDYLTIFNTATMVAQGNERFFYDWYPTLNWLQSEIYNWQVRFEEESEGNDYHTKCCQRALEKAQKYFELTDKTPIAFAAVMLNPTLKHRWFEQLWQEGTIEQQQWIQDVLKQVKELWQSEYKRASTTSIHSRPRATPSLSTVRRSAAASDKQRTIEETFMERLADFKRVKFNNGTCSIDALDEYLLADNIYLDDDTKFDCLAFWFTQRHSQPELAKFAFDTLAIPVMSEDNERSFSAGRDLITYRRNRLMSDIIEATQCLRQSYGPPQQIRTRKGTLDNAFDNEDKLQEDYDRQEALKLV